MQEDFKDRLKKAIEIRGLKQIELSEKANISRSTISQYISGYTKPKSKKLYLIAQALDVNEAWLMGYDVPMERDAIIKIQPDGFTTEELNHIENLRQLNTTGKNKVINYTKDLTEMPKYQKENNISEFPRKTEKQIWEEPGMEYLMPIANHDDGLTDEEKERMNEIINDFLKKKNL